MALFGETAPMVIVGLFVTLAALIFHVIGFATPYWYKVTGNDYVHIGLWQSCGKTTKAGNVCYSITVTGVPLPDAYKAAQALESIALVAYLAAAVFAFLKVFVVKDNGVIYVATALVNFASGCFGLVGVIVYATQDLFKGEIDEGGNFHFSFAFCIIASIGGLFAGVVFILAWRWVHLRQ